MTGKLYLVGTPIGNLEDITHRAVRVLGEVDIVAAEDTRRTLKLLNHLGIHKPMVSYHEHNKYSAGQNILARLGEGRCVALVSDAGMPVISDPGCELVAQARIGGFTVEVIPGPCAVSAALALSGMSGAQYVFFGFLPRDGKERDEALKTASQTKCTLVFYEAPHRLLETLGDLARLNPNRRIAVCKDITKLFERTDIMTLEEAAQHFALNPPKGEYALVVEGAADEKSHLDTGEARGYLLEYLSAGMSPKDAVKKAAALLDMPRNELYEMVLEIKDEM